MNPPSSPHRNRLWTPWRMRYIGGEAREQGCIFCNRLGGNTDVASLILHRSEHAFVIMNLYPYNTGHVMVVPYAHEAELDALDDATLIDMGTLLPRTVTALRRVLNCDGFNIGLNLGADAGAGVAEHLHQHVVPRWEGDANFMPVLAGTMVIPEVIPATYAKLRAEMTRVLHQTHRFDVVVLSDDGNPTAWLHDGTIPAIEPASEKPVWKAALATVDTDGAEVVGWSGGARADDTSTTSGLVIRTPGQPTGDGWTDVSLHEPGNAASEQDAGTLARVRAQAFPWIGAPDTAY